MKNFIIFVNGKKKPERKKTKAKKNWKDENTQRVSTEISCATLKNWEFQPYIKSLLYEHIRSKWNWKTKDGKKYDKGWKILFCHHLFAWWPRFLFEEHFICINWNFIVLWVILIFFLLICFCFAYCAMTTIFMHLFSFFYSHDLITDNLSYIS